MEENEITPIAAIIPAAGQGTRLGGQTKKQFQLLAGKPLLVRTIERILLAPEIRWLVVAVPESDLDLAREILEDAIPDSVELKIAVGGKTRQISVWNAVKEVPSAARVVTIHDAARPFLDPKWISQSVELCTHFDGAIVAIPATDTLKEVTSVDNQNGIRAEGKIKGTLSREVIWQAQTPQTFKIVTLLKAIANAQEKGLTGTDEAYLVEAIGGQVAIVKGSPNNFKITNRSEWDYTEWKLEHDQDRHRI